MGQDPTLMDPAILKQKPIQTDQFGSVFFSGFGSVFSSLGSIRFDFFGYFDSAFLVVKFFIYFMWFFWVDDLLYLYILGN